MSTAEGTPATLVTRRAAATPVAGSSHAAAVGPSHAVATGPSPAVATGPSHAVVAVDIGGTTVKGLVRTGSGVVDRIVLPTFGSEPSVVDTPGGPALAAVYAVVDHLTASARAAGHRVTGIGVCTPGVVDPSSGTVVVAVNLDWTDLPVADLLRARYAVPVAVAHDARAATMAEIDARRTAGRDTDDMVFIPIGTGISASLVVAGQLVQGAVGGAGEVGHICVRPGGEACTCGQSGCVEAYASARNVLRRYRAAGGTITGGTEAIVAAIDDDPVAAEVWADAVDALAAGIAIVSAILDPAVVVIGGGLGEAGERLLAPVRTAVDARLGWRSTPRIEQSLVGAGAGLAGAALIAEQVASAALAQDGTTPASTLPASTPAASTPPALHDRSTP